MTNLPQQGVHKTIGNPPTTSISSQLALHVCVPRPPPTKPSSTHVMFSNPKNFQRLQQLGI
jgi:hypothetical protein